MNKEAYPWIGIAIGMVIGMLFLGIGGGFAWLNAIVIGPVFGVFYGWLIERNKRALIIGGVIGSILGLHPLSFFAFALSGAYAVLNFNRFFKSVKKDDFLMTIVASFIFTVMLVIILSLSEPPSSAGDWVECVVIIIVGSIPLINILIGVIVYIGAATDPTGLTIILSLLSPPLFLIPLFALRARKKLTWTL